MLNLSYKENSMSKEMLSAKQAAENWKISTRRVNQLCNNNEIEGAIKVGGLWKIPSSALKPDTLRSQKATKFLPLPVGISSYKEVSLECYYVDKTLLIKDIIDEHNKVTLFTRPRRFGKSLTMDMLKTYFEKTDKDTSIYFKKQNIWKCDDLYKAYQGAYPVIFLSFKDAHQSSWKDMYESLCLTIRDEFKRHIDILDNPYISDIDKNFFNKILNNQASKVEYQVSLGQLSHVLSTIYKSRVVVIIDEYDTPIQEGYSNNYYDEVISFMRNLFSNVLKDNDDLEFGILTGILRIAKESLFSGLNNLVVNTILDEKYSNYFGFSSKEVEKMAAYYKHKNKIDEIKEWYDGYLFGQNEIYNPWSVISYFNNNCIPKAFWSKTSSNDIILDIIKNSNLEMQESLTKLLQDKPIQALINTDIIYPEIKSSQDAIYSFLLLTGYLKIDKVINTTIDNQICSLLIPNKEIKSVFKKEIIDNISNNTNSSVIRNFHLALKTNNKDILEETLHQYLLNSVSIFDTNKENFYHGMMLGLLAVMSDEYLITSNRESGEGRFDVQLKPINNHYPGIIIEFKALDNADEKALEKSAEQAIKQIQNKNYTSELKANNINDIQIYGIAFCKKKVAVKIVHLDK